MNPKVSIIIPIYNGEKFLSKCIFDLSNQTFQDVEIIFVNDGSTDNSLEMLNKFAATNSRVKIISQGNAGAGAARNVGLSIAKGEYLSILDADDFFEPEMIEKAYSKAKQFDADIVVWSCDIFRNSENKFYSGDFAINKDLLPKSEPFSGTDIKINALRAFVGWAWDKLFKRSFIEREGLLFQEQRTTNDAFFVFCAILKANRIVTMDDVLIHHRESSGSLSVTREKSWHCFYDALIAIQKQLKSWDLFDRFKDDFINYSAGFSLWHLETLTEPAYSLLYEKLHDEWLYHLGIVEYPQEMFYNQDDYSRCNHILKYSREEDKLQAKLEAAQKLQYCQQELDTVRRELDAIRYELQIVYNDKERILNSRSYRIGRILTYLPRIIRNFFHNKH